MLLLISGKIEGIKEGKDQQGNIAKKQLQFLSRSETGALEFTEVKSEVNDPEFAKYRIGQEVTLPVKVNQYNGKLFYKTDPEGIQQMLEEDAREKKQ